MLLNFYSLSDRQCNQFQWFGVYFHGELTNHVFKQQHEGAPDLVACDHSQDIVFPDVHRGIVYGVECIAYLWETGKSIPHNYRGLIVEAIDLPAREYALECYHAETESL